MSYAVNPDSKQAPLDAKYSLNRLSNPCLYPKNNIADVFPVFISSECDIHNLISPVINTCAITFKKPNINRP